MDLLRTRQVDPVHQSPQTRMYGFFTHRTVPPSRLYSSGFLSLPDHLRRLPSPTHSGRRSLGHAVFAALQVLFSRRTTDRASLAISLALIGPLTPMPTGTLSVLLRSRAVLLYRAARKHLGAAAECERLRLRSSDS